MSLAPDEPANACGNCRAPMQRLRVAGHYQRTVEVDLCAPCHLVWFDGFESVQLTGAGALKLLEAMAAAQRLAHEPLSPRARCPRCDGALKTVNNRSRWGPSVHLECQRGHGTLQTFAEWLAEKGLIHTLGPADRATLEARDGGLACLNCGAPIARGDPRCRHCGTLPGVVDIARLAHALDPEGATETHPVHRAATRFTALQCLACGAPQPAATALRCGHCGATLAPLSLSDALARVAPLAAALAAHDRHPAPHVRRRRLERLREDLPRRREWARQMEAEAQGRASFEIGDSDDDRPFWSDLQQRPGRVAMAALLLLFVWWTFWR